MFHDVTDLSAVNYSGRDIIMEVATPGGEYNHPTQSLDQDKCRCNAC